MFWQQTQMATDQLNLLDVKTLLNLINSYNLFHSYLTQLRSSKET